MTGAGLKPAPVEEFRFMVELLSKEKRYIATLERRLEYLKHRAETLTDKELSWDRQEQKALRWALEVVQHAAATNCEEAFIYNKSRLPWTEEMRRMAEHLNRKPEQEEAGQLVSQAS